jgi:cyclopropane-fatty-acyl-phospholipid synthase
MTPSSASQAGSGEARRITLRLLDELFRGAGDRQAGFRLWDGTLWPDAGPHPATIVLQHPGALRAMLLPGHELGLAEAYLYNDFDVEGDIESVFDLAEEVARGTSGWRKKIRSARDLVRLPAEGQEHAGRRGPARLSGERHSVERDRQAVTFHYDVSNDFYALWLDRRMVYSCAYFPAEGSGLCGEVDKDLDMAQACKLDYICRKLRLRPGQRLLDIGCGWGGLVMHAAERYGVDATGITLSRPQVDLAQRRIAEAGLADRCRVLPQDYRQVDASQPYDVLVSVGMFEHVGEGLLPAYFAQAMKLLAPGGVFLNHGIARRATDKPYQGPNFNDTYVFPDGELTPINVTLRAAENSGFEVRDVESLREHYALTLRHWVRRLKANHERALEFVDEPTYRVWRLFMSGSAHGFTHGRLNVYQTLLVKPLEDGGSRLPLTRADWYV